jgi:hypothetical protein
MAKVVPPATVRHLKIKPAPETAAGSKKHALALIYQVDLVL